jgi:hypothetical protein
VPIFAICNFAARVQPIVSPGAKIWQETGMMDDVIITDSGAIRMIRMNRAAKKNAITFAMYDAMATRSRAPTPPARSVA